MFLLITHHTVHRAIKNLFTSGIVLKIFWERLSTEDKHALFTAHPGTTAANYFRSFIIPFSTLQVAPYDILMDNLI